MKNSGRLAATLLIAVLCIGCKKQDEGANNPAGIGKTAERQEAITESKGTIRLPTPRYRGAISVEEAISGRTSTRRYKKEPLTAKDVSQLLWAAGGKNVVEGVTCATRTYPSASATYPLEIYLVAGDVTDIPGGVYIYGWQRHTITLAKEGDLRPQLAAAVRNNRMIADAPMSVVFTVHDSQTADTDERPSDARYTEVGHAGQNVHLQAEAMGLGTVVIGHLGSESAEAVGQALGAKDEYPLYIMPVGKKL